MLCFFSGYSDAVIPKKAIVQSLSNAAIDKNSEISLIILHSTLGYDLNKLLSGFEEACPNAEIIGCSGSGVISRGWVSESMRSLSVIFVKGEEFTVSSIKNITAENCNLKSGKCAARLMEKLPEINMVMAFAPGLVVDGDGVVDGIESVFGSEVKILGGLSGFGGRDPRTPVFHGNKVLDQSIVMVGFADPDLEVVQAAHHGYEPHTDYKFTITKAQGTQVSELNGKPAWSVLMKSFDLPVETTPLELIPILALGSKLNKSQQQEYDNECILHAPLILNENDHSFMLQAPIAEGREVVSCQRNEDYLFEGINRLGKRITTKINGRELVAIFQMDCMARGKLTSGTIEKNEIIQNIQQLIIGDTNIPWLGDYGFGEFCTLDGKNRFHNYTTSLSVIVRN